MNHRIGRIVFATLVGLAVAAFSYRWITDPAGRTERAIQENVVLAARSQLIEVVGVDDLAIVDPLNPDREAGKTYVYREGEGWSVSGYYRRGDGDRWYPYLMSLDAALVLERLKIDDPGLVERASVDPRLELSP